MITIFILEENPMIRSDIEKEIKRYAHKHRLDIKIRMSTEETNNFLEAIEMKNTPAVYFIDGETSSEQKNAVDLGCTMRTQNDRAFLIYLGDPDKLISEIRKYHLEVLDIISKNPYKKETIHVKVHECLDTIRERIQDEEITKLYAVYQSFNKTNH